MSSVAVAVRPRKSAALISKAESFMLDAIEAHKNVSRKMGQIKEHAFDCGLFLLSAHHIYEVKYPGEWLNLLACYKGELSQSTAYRYMQFAQAVQARAIEENPSLTNPLALQKAAREMALQSNLTFLQLLRHLAPAKQKEAAAALTQKPEQLIFPFNWSVFDSSLWALEREGSNVLKEVPTDELQQTYARLKSAARLTENELNERGQTV